MKSIGTVRQLDTLGRLSIPKATRDQLNMDIGSKIIFETEGDRIIVRRYVEEKRCMVTGELSQENITIGDGENKVILSNAGAEKVLEMLEKNGYGN